MNLNAINSEVHMYIDDEEVVCDKEIQVAEQLLNTSSTVLYNCYPLSWEQDKDYTSRFYFPKDYSKFVMTINGETKFRGVVKRSKPVDLSPFKAHFVTLQVLDYKTFLSEGNQLNFVLKDVTVEEAIQQILNAYEGYNFILGKLKIGTIAYTIYDLEGHIVEQIYSKTLDIIKNYNCNDKTPYDCLNYIADLTQSVWFTRYEGDKIAVDFYTYNNLPNGEYLLYDKDYFRNNSIVSISHTFDTEDYRNVQIITADDVESNITLENNFIVNGVEETFSLDEPISAIASVTLAGKTITFGTRESGINYDLYYAYGSNEITLVCNNIAGTMLKVNYYPIVDGRQKLKNPVEIKRIATQQSNVGEIARYEKREEAYTDKELGLIAQSYLYFKGKPSIELEVKTLNNDIWNIGDTVYFNINDVSELEELMGNYVVKNKSIQIIQNNASRTAQIFYVYELINNFNFENAINFFDNQRAKQIGNINEGDFINRYIDFELNTNIIFDGFTTEEIEIEAQNELDAELDFNL